MSSHTFGTLWRKALWTYLLSMSTCDNIVAVGYDQRGRQVPQTIWSRQFQRNCMRMVDEGSGSQCVSWYFFQSLDYITNDKHKGRGRYRWYVYLFNSLGWQEIASSDEGLKWVLGSIQSLADDSFEFGDEGTQVCLNEADKGFQELEGWARARSSRPYSFHLRQHRGWGGQLRFQLQHQHERIRYGPSLVSRPTRKQWSKNEHEKPSLHPFTYSADVLDDLKEDFEDTLVDVFDLSNEWSQNLDKKQRDRGQWSTSHESLRSHWKCSRWGHRIRHVCRRDFREVG